MKSTPRPIDGSLFHFVISWQIQFYYRPKHLLIVKIMWTLDIKCQAFKLSTCCCLVSGLGNVYPLPWRLHFASCTMLVNASNNLQRMQAICQTAELHSNTQLLRHSDTLTLGHWLWPMGNSLARCRSPLKFSLMSIWLKVKVIRILLSHEPSCQLELSG